MRQPFYEVVAAEAVQQLAAERSRKQVYEVHPEPGAVMQLLHGRLRRARSNAIYGELVEFYSAALRAFLSSEQGPWDVARAMVAAGDGRVNHPGAVCFIRLDAEQVLMFGVDYL